MIASPPPLSSCFPYSLLLSPLPFPPIYIPFPTPNLLFSLCPVYPVFGRLLPLPPPFNQSFVGSSLLA